MDYSKLLCRMFCLLIGTLLCLLIFAAYNDKHGQYVDSFVYFKFFNFLLLIQIGGIALFTLVHFVNNSRVKRLFFNPLMFVAMGYVMSLAVFFSFDTFVSKKLSFIQAAVVSRSILGFAFYLAIISLCARSIAAGFGVKRVDSAWLSLALAIMILVLFGIGSFGMLNIFTVVLIFFLIVVVGFKENFKLFHFFIKPLKDHQNINYWGFIIFYLLLIALTINFLSILTPYPYGFDARNYYMNSTQLIAQNNGLIEGFQPYNWQLLMSLGFILFDSHEVAISISFFAFILCLIAINDFTKEIFKLDINYRLLIMLLITVTPAFYNQLSIDVKIDFALLFYQIVIVHLFVKLCQAKDWDWKMIIIFGLLNGFALGIKFTHLYLIASMIIVYWGIKGGVVGLISGASLCVGVFLIAKIDDVGGLRQYHLGVDYQQWIVLAIGAGLFVVLALTERQKWLKLMRFSVLFGAIAIIPMLPWMGKNYLETKSLSPKTLLMGKAPGYKMNLNTFIKNYEAKK